ncbi:MAG: SMP-30/gluconolactonase/LRE family protein [Cumulibacter sp.]
MASRWWAGVKEFLRPSSAPDRAVPAMDGAFAPNDQLDELTEAIATHDPQDVVHYRDEVVLVAAGQQIEAIDIGDHSRRVVAELPGLVTGIHVTSGDVLACVDGHGLVRVDIESGAVSTLSVDERAHRLSAVVELDGRIFATSYAAEGTWYDWPRDLMTKGASGALLEVQEDGSLRTLADGLAWAYGLCVAADGTLLFTESWRHRVCTYDLSSGRTGTLRERLPGYPARIHAGSDGELLLTMFAARTQLVEFVLREDEYRTRMMNEIPMDDWVTPAFRKTGSIRAPFQLGGAVHLGEVKPWAPSRSYGLVAVLDAAGDVRLSAHSRAGGVRHGITASCAVADRLVLACYGTSELLVGAIDMESRMIS